MPVKPIRVEEIGPIRAFDRVFQEFDAVVRRKDRGQLARFALVSWSGFGHPTVRLFRTQRDLHMTQKLLYETTRLALQAGRFRKPVRMLLPNRSIPKVAL